MQAVSFFRKLRQRRGSPTFLGSAFKASMDTALSAVAGAIENHGPFVHLF
jgi:hypothetical protein